MFYIVTVALIFVAASFAFYLSLRMDKKIEAQSSADGGAERPNS